MTLRRAAAALAAAGCLLALAGPATGSDWQEFPAPIPPGGKFGTPPGYVADLAFVAPNRGLMAVGGNNSVREGLYSWDGVGWHQLAVVCGGGRAARIAWAGPTEFWTIARPSLPRDQTAGLALCHFKDGEVVGSYSTPADAEDPFRTMLAAACNGPSDCWFGGPFATDGLGRRSGAFHLHWDGSTLQTVYGPQGRAVSDLLAVGGAWWESTNLGPQREDPDGAVTLAEPESEPHLLHRIAGTAFTDDPFVADRPDDTELLALDSDGEHTWAAGGGVKRDGQSVGRTPLVARLGGGAWHELALTPTDPSAPLPAELAAVDIAAIPGTEQAWIALADNSAFSGESAQPVAARVDAAAGTATVQALTGSGAVAKGAATRVACPGRDDCWLATADGVLYRLAGAPSYPRDEEPAFQGTITVRPNEAAEQAIPDDPPEDDSSLAVPPVDLYPDLPAGAVGAASCPRLRSLVSKVKVKVRGVKAPILEVRFRVDRTAKIGMTAKRHGKVVARARLRTLKRGNRRLVLHLSRRRWPTKLAFTIRDDSGLKRTCTASSNDSNTVETP